MDVYTALIGLGAALPLMWQLWHTHDERVLTYAFVIGLAALLAGRAGYVAIHWGYFGEHREQVFSLSNPGFSEHLVLLGAWSVGRIAWSVKRVTATPFNLLLIASATWVGIGASIGCITAGCAFGREVFWQNGAQSVGWLLRVDWPDSLGISNPRWPTQLFMAIWLLISWVILIASYRWRGLSPAQLLTIWLMLFAIGDSAIQLLRADETLLFRNIRIEQYFDVILFILSLYRLIHRNTPTTPQT